MGRLSPEDFEKMLADLDAEEEVVEELPEELPEEEPEPPPPEEPQPKVINDPLGTVRYDIENNLFYVCSVSDVPEEAEHFWKVYFPKPPQCLGDQAIDPQECLLVGQLP